MDTRKSNPKGVKPKLTHKPSKKEKECIKYWLSELERRRLTLLASTIRDDLSAANTPAAKRLSERCEKRMQYDDPSLRPKAYTDFYELNKFVGTDEHKITLDPEIIANARLFITTALEKYTKANTGSIQCELDLTLLLTSWRYGPGASIGCKETHFADKIRQTNVSVTEKAMPLFRLLRRMNPFLHVNDDCIGINLVKVRGSCLSTVPKNKETHRTICTEPLGNMALQLAAGMYIEGALRCIGLDLATQQLKNRRLANAGSIDGTLCTLDLKNASDLIACLLIKILWPASWYSLFMTIRSPEHCYAETGEVWHKLHMMSTMGNGFTFPMMTMTLLALVYAYNAVNHKGRNLHVDYTTHAVFGDDIICPTESFEGICDVLTSAGLMINRDKSYASGPFRESCGGDYHEGAFITPFYVESLRNDSEIYVAANKCLSWCGYNNTPLPKTLKLLRSMFRWEPLLVPEWEDPSSGLLSKGAPHRYKYIVPINENVVYEQKSSDLSYTMLCVLGGYVETRRDGSIVYTRRSSNTIPKYELKNARYSKSYRDGSDPSLRAPNVSTIIERLITFYMQ